MTNTSDGSSVDAPRADHGAAAAAGPAADLACGATPPPAGHARVGQVLYLPASGRMVVLYEHTPPQWWCLLLADPAGSTAPGSMVRITDGQVLTALPVPLGDPAKHLPAHVFANVWLTQVAAGGDTTRNLLARALAKQVRAAHRRVVVVNDQTRRLLADAAQIADLDIIDGMVMALITDGFLQVVPPLTPTGQAVFRLVLRYTPWTVPGPAGRAG